MDIIIQASDFKISPSFKTLKLLAFKVSPVEVMSVIISDEPVKGYASVAPKLSTNLNWVTPLENKNSLVKFGYLVATLNLFFFLSLNSNAISSKSAIVWTSIQGSGIATTNVATLVVAIPDPWIDVQTIADLEEIAFEFRDKKKKRLRVATKYPNLTREFLFSKGVTQFKLVDSLGATEAYPFTGSSEIITDITSTGETLKANNLRVLKDGEILKSEACMMISKSSSKNKSLQSLARLLSKN